MNVFQYSGSFKKVSCLVAKMKGCCRKKTPKERNNVIRQGLRTEQRFALVNLPRVSSTKPAENAHNHHIPHCVRFDEMMMKNGVIMSTLPLVKFYSSVNLPVTARIATVLSKQVAGRL